MIVSACGDHRHPLVAELEELLHVGRRMIACACKYGLFSNANFDLALASIPRPQCYLFRSRPEEEPLVEKGSS